MAKTTYPKINSDFAILNVKVGRNALNAHFAGAPRLGPTPKKYLIPVTIKGFVSGVWGHDDGVSREFQIDVSSVELA